jgi:predicted AlkP superfamily pyrophosphatase or phosphodiesterase
MPRLLRRSPFGSLKPLAAAAAAFAVFGVACSPEPTQPAEPAGITPTGVHVVLISLDGLRPDAITATNAPTLVQLAKQGAATLYAQTVLPSLTLPSHTSMVTGLLPEKHHVTWNDDVSGDTAHVAAATIFDLAKQAGLSTAMFVGKSKLSAITHAGAPAILSMPPAGATWKADTVAARLHGYLSSAENPKPDLTFIHLPDIDLAGHASGWMSPVYLATVRHVDSVFARIWIDLKLTFGTDLVLIVTADHGGSEYGHGDGTELHRTTPWIAWGKYVSPLILPAGVRAVDVAPTMLWVLGITPPESMDGVPVRMAFRALKP